MTKKTILIVTGEASGDVHGAFLARALYQKKEGIRILGVGGSEMKKEGVELIVDSAELAVVGVVEVFRQWKAIWSAFRTVRAILTRERIDCVVLIDYPGFNLLVATVANKKKIPVVYYICPQVWAWGRSRVKVLSRLVTKMIVILPFEEEFYRKAGIPCEFVGHPLLDEVDTCLNKEVARRSMRIPSASCVIGLLPGSRRAEIRSHLPVMLMVVSELKRERPGIVFLLAVAPSLCRDDFVRIRHPWPEDVLLVEGATDQVIAASDCVIVASGTATLQAAFYDTPPVIVYRVSPLTYLLGRGLVRVSHCGLVNLIAGEEVAPELIQHNMTPQNILSIVTALIGDAGYREKIRKGLSRVRTRLGPPGASSRAAEIVLNLL